MLGRLISLHCVDVMTRVCTTFISVVQTLGVCVDCGVWVPDWRDCPVRNGACDD